MSDVFNTVYGNLIALAETGEYDAVLQCCNCQNRMGAGVALDIARHWPEVEAADQRTERGDPKKLGTYSAARVIRGQADFMVYNLYGQFRYGPASEKHLDNEALRCALTNVAISNAGQRKRFLFPLLGTGNAGGDWSKIRNIIQETLGEHDLTLVRMRRR